MELLDCTLRDGGYYNNWDFSDETAEKYFKAMEILPIDILEIGYRSRPQKAYEGKYFYCPDFVLKQARVWAPSKKLGIMLNEKDCAVSDLEGLLQPCQGYIDIIRIAVAPERFSEAICLAKAIKEFNFKVGFNVMYMSKLTEQSAVFEKISELEGLVDYFNLVDSYGGIYPETVKKIVQLCKSKTSVPIGFHGHNNMELVFANSLAAIEAGCDIIDATICGMGRGAGNLKTELWLTHLAKIGTVSVDFNALSDVVSAFETLQEKYRWGTNLPYMVSGASSLPQKDVMDWVTTRFYSINSIIRALHNQNRGEKDNIKLPLFESQKQYNRALIVGGGPSVLNDKEALLKFIDNSPDVCVINASTKHSHIFRNVKNEQIYCLVGNEGHRMEDVFNSLENIKGNCVLPPFPRKMGTYIPNEMRERAFELRDVSFTEKFKDSHTALAIQSAIEIGVKSVLIAGYDGYPDESISSKEQALFSENEYLFRKATKSLIEITAITSTRYSIKTHSVYSLVS